jgi:hypothetical protein
LNMQQRADDARADKTDGVNGLEQLSPADF